MLKISLQMASESNFACWGQKCSKMLKMSLQMGPESPPRPPSRLLQRETERDIERQRETEGDIGRRRETEGDIGRRRGT